MRCEKIGITDNLGTQLRSKTGEMLSKVIYGSPKNGAEAVKDYYHFVNENNLHGPAVVAYYTRINELKDYGKYVSQEISERISKVDKLIEEFAKKNPEVQAETDTFVKRLNRDYPNTLEDRISLANQGAVLSNRVEPKSKFKKFMVFLNRFMQIEE